jgi:hypothetical protein
VRLLFLQDHRETEKHFTATGMPSQRINSDKFRFCPAAFYQTLMSKVGLAAVKAAALRINLNIDSCSIVASPSARPFTQSPCSRHHSFHTISLDHAFTSVWWSD